MTSGIDRLEAGLVPHYGEADLAPAGYRPDEILATAFPKLVALTIARPRPSQWKKSFHRAHPMCHCICCPHGPDALFYEME